MSSQAFATCLLVAALAVGLPGSAPAGDAVSGGAAPAWTEVPPLVPLSLGTARLEKVTVQAQALASGEIEVSTTYLLANATRRKANVRLAIPLGYDARLAYLGETVRMGGEWSAPTAIRYGMPATELPASALEATPLDASSPVGAATSALTFTITIEHFDATELTVVHRVPWGAVATPRHFPGEKGFSLSFAGLSAWPGELEALEVGVVFEPALLGPASYAEPMPYRYDSKGLHWKLEKPADGALEVPERVTIVVFTDYADRTFEGVYFARFEAEDASYPWTRRFFHAKVLTAREDGSLVLSRAHVDDLRKALESMELEILARNGKRFDDTFLQMRFQQESWYKPDRQFSEDRIRPVERWNLGYARCQTRAARTVLSALEKTRAEEMPARGRRFKMLVAAFERCDERFWNPKLRERERPRLQ